MLRCAPKTYSVLTIKAPLSWIYVEGRNQAHIITPIFDYELSDDHRIVALFC